ncbi:hypothetical protein N7492_008409 [Penicillium capsulatum]|uniref:C2H2-type domain-containing protein n=1 Tax=Penicillium capsulatum TaxID=69766 RepID=A0A9W9LFW7_9EURO|nr:hypothetical protein N7492_008409 [Penicillium capsulatum]KAJ6105811.1 hypothetical protein N7512_009328 [Penicillium capsulatum]
MISPSSTLSHGHHRRQISSPAPFNVAQPRAMAGLPPRRTHRRGQTVDYGSFSPQAAVDRRSATNKVTQLRDFFNEKSGFPHHALAAQQFASSMQDSQSFTSSNTPVHSQYQPGLMWTREELDGIYGEMGDTASFPNPVAPALARSASDNTESNAAMKHNLHRMRQDRGQRGYYAQQNPPMISKEQVAAFTQSMQPVSVQHDDLSPKINPYLSYTSPLTPDATPMKSSFDFSTYSNDQTPTKSQSFSIPRTPATCEMQRAQSLQGVLQSSPVQMNQQMPSPASSPCEPYAELAAMPSPGSCGVSPQKAHMSSQPASGKRQKMMHSPAPVDRSMEEQHAQTVNDLDLDARVKASVKESSVSSDEIAKYIAGPDPKDNKWVCLFDNCHGRFGRKENIKSHIQTHLNDRQYVCDQCDRDFVRSHDLKRHLKTHSNNKPFICRCGAPFARQDALTRHRQRDMCVGGYSGFVPKTTKRGRPPKKNRPAMDARQEKATRTRQRVAQKSESVSPVKVECPDFNQPPVFTSPNYDPSNCMSSFTPPTSPGAVLDSVQSPYQPADSITSKQFDNDVLPLPLSPPQMAHTRYTQAMEQFDSGASTESSSQEGLYSDSALSPYDMSSPHTAPTLAESTVGSEIDLFMSQDPSEQFQEEFDQLAGQTYSGLPCSYTYVDPTDFGLGTSIYSDIPGKSFSALGSLDEQMDALSSEFLADP